MARHTDHTRPPPSPKHLSMDSEQAVNVNVSLSTDVHLAVGDGGHRGLDSRTGNIASAGLVAVVEFSSHICCVVGVEHRRCSPLHLARSFDGPYDGVGRAVG